MSFFFYPNVKHKQSQKYKECKVETDNRNAKGTMAQSNGQNTHTHTVGHLPECTPRSQLPPAVPWPAPTCCLLHIPPLSADHIPSQSVYTLNGSVPHTHTHTHTQKKKIILLFVIPSHKPSFHSFLSHLSSFSCPVFDRPPGLCAALTC